MSAKPLPYPPPWQDMPTLCAHTCLTPPTVDAWVAKGILPPPRKRSGKLMWKWSEVDEKLSLGDVGGSPDGEAEGVRNGSRSIDTDRRPRH